jgi:virginiamycin B lyase
VGAVMHPAAITVAADGIVWFTDSSPGSINVVRMDHDRGMLNFQVTGTSASFGITIGPDGAVWFTEVQGNKIGRLRKH